MNLKPLALVPVLSIFASIVLILFLGFSEKIAFNPPYLLLALNLVFWTTATLAIAFISAKSFLKEDSSVVLVNSCSIIIFGLPVIISGWVQTFSVDKSIALSNPCILVASLLQVLSSILAFQGKQETNTSNRKRLLTIAYLSSVIFVLVNTTVALLGYYPMFFVASGPTLLRQVVLGSAVFFFGVAAIIFGVQYLRSKSPSIYWYALAIGLFSVGLFSAFEQKAIGDVPTWLGRISLYVGTLYLTAAIFSSKQEAGTDLAGKWAESFRSNSKQIADFFSNMIDGFVYCRIVTDDSGKPIDYVYLDANNAAERFIGTKRENLLGKRATEVFPEISTDPTKLIDIYSNVALTGEAISLERYSPVVQKWYHASIYSPQKGYFVSIFEDITERKKAEEALKQANEGLEERIQQRTKDLSLERQRLYSVLESIPAMVCLLTPDHHVAFANRSFKERFGESNGRYCYDFCFGNKEPCPFCESFKVLETGKPHRWQVNSPDGSIIDAYDFPFTDSDGSKMVLEMDIDITEQKRMEKQLKDSERLAAIGATAGMVGHDIRNPLQAITGDVYLARLELEGLPDGEEKNAILESLIETEKNIDYINKIVQDLQDYARPLNPNAGQADLKFIIETLLKKNGIPENVEVSVKVEDEARKIVADTDYLNRILYNLVTNAVQAMPNGGKLTISTDKEANDVVISVKDTGVGIPETAKNKLFTPMFTTKSKGQGFGLAVVKRMTESLGGTVSFESEEGKGTTFSIRLPNSPPTKKLSH